MNDNVCVIGSGPSAMACAHTLSRSGVQVTILDVGMELDDRSSRLLDQFRQDGDVSRLLGDVHRLRAEHTKLSGVQPGKHLFGSDHPYRTVPETEIHSGADAVIRSSLGKGGLTAVWGATVSTAVPKDIADWPIAFADLEPHYRALEDVMSVASPLGEMQGVFPIEIGSPPTFPLGMQGQRLLDRLKKYEEALLDDGIHVGRAKLAVGPKYSRDGLGCTPCGLCMHGCPNQAIFSAAYVLEDLRSRPGIRYRSNVLAESFCETGDRVDVRVKELGSGDRATLSFDRVFLACGVVNSTAIVARSLGMIGHDFTIKDSQKYIFPMLLWHRSKGAMEHRANTLAQIFLAVDNPDVSDRIVQVQYYGYNDLILDPLRSRLGQRATGAIAHLAAPLLERLVIGFAYLHSRDSGTLSLRVHKLGVQNRSLGEVRGQPNRRSASVMRALLALLKRHRRAHGGVPLLAGLQTTRPGDSQHIGSTLPMSATPDRYETDLLGRPFSCKRVHVVDASVLPTIPGTPIVFTAMANASRIAAGSVRESGRA